MTPLEEAYAIACGETLRMPTVEHIEALHDEYLRVLALNGTLERSLQMLAELHKQDMDARDAWATEQEAAQPQKVSA